MQPTKIQEFLRKAKENNAKTLDDDFGIEVHHLLMKTYGWIPLKEFEELPIPTLINLVEKIVRDFKEEEKAWKGKNEHKRINQRRL